MIARVLVDAIEETGYLRTSLEDVLETVKDLLAEIDDPSLPPAEISEAQAQVLGEDRVMTLTLAEKILDALKEEPEIVNIVGKLVPHTVVTGDGAGGLAGAAAVLQGAFTERGTTSDEK